jgi:glucokinase
LKPKSFTIGVDIGGTNIRLSLMSRRHEVLYKLKEPLGADPLFTIHKLLDSLFNECPDDIIAIGVAVAGIIDRESGMVLKSPNIPGLNGINLVSEISVRHKIPVLIENDANAAAYGEKISGAGGDYKSFVMITLGTGIGAGIVVENELLPVAAEIGHITINHNGNKCGCGNTGCLEAHASASAIVEYAISHIKDGSETILKKLYNGNYFKVTAEDIYKSALEGDSLARDALREAGRNLGLGLATVVNIFSPEAIILMGGLTGSWNIYIENAIKEASRRSLRELFERTKIIPSYLGDDAGIIGSAALALKRFSPT